MEGNKMIVSDIMNTNVVSIPSNTSLAEARRIMEAHRFRRLPVVDRGKLVGIVTRDALDKTGPSQLTTFSIHEISYLLNKITVKEIMHRDVVTVSPEMTVEEAVALAQSKQVGALVVTRNDVVIGMCTTNDFFYRILNPILGIGLPGSRIIVRNCNKGSDIEKVISVINKLNIGITNLFLIYLPDVDKHDLVVHLNTPDSAKAVAEISKAGFTTEDRPR
jgi:acetoin utilization protein AcuB